jgi:hypothetical protein
MSSAYTFTYQTIHYVCGHSVIRRILRHQATCAERRSDCRCEHCSELRERRYAMAREEQQAREEERWPVSPDGQWPPVASVVAS